MTISMKEQFSKQVAQSLIDDVCEKLQILKEKMDEETVSSRFYTIGDDNRKMNMSDGSVQEIYWVNGLILTSDYDLYMKFIEEFKLWQQIHGAKVNTL